MDELKGLEEFIPLSQIDIYTQAQDNVADIWPPVGATGYPGYDIDRYALVERSEVDPEVDPENEPEVEPETLATDNTRIFETNEIFPSKESLVKWCTDKGLECNMVMVTKRSENPRPGKTAGVVYLGCERGGTYRVHTKKGTEKTVPKRRRKVNTETGSKLIGSPFAIKGYGTRGREGEWRVKVMVARHNHETTETLTNHAFVARLRPKERELVFDMTKSGSKPADILSAIKRRNIKNVSVLRTIYNEQSRMKLKEMEGRSAMQHLLECVNKNHYLEWHMSDPLTNVVKSIFWAHPEAVKMAKAFRQVLVVDCTYKTNRYNMPLLEIVGVTSTHQTFSVACCFMGKETQVDYEWALQKLKAIYDDGNFPKVFVTDREFALINVIDATFPGVDRLLCRWHIGKNITAQCKKDYTTKELQLFTWDWAQLVSEESEASFLEAWGTFEKKWGGSYQTTLEYIRATWWPLRAYFVCAWTNKVKHFENGTTNRVKQAHAKLKRHICNATRPFQSVWEAMHNMIDSQLNEVKGAFQKNLTTVLHSHSIPRFSELRGKVSLHALGLILEEIALIGYGDEDVDFTSCGCSIRSVNGLPCFHEIGDYDRQGIPIPLGSIDEQWKKFTHEPVVAVSSDLFRTPEMELLIRKWESATEEEKVMIRGKIKELGEPSTSTLVEPVPVVPKGRPKGSLSRKAKVQAKSTKRNPSQFEYARCIDEPQSNFARHSKGTKRGPPSCSKSPIVVESKEILIRGRNSGKKYVSSLPKHMIPHVFVDRNVLSDGNCGFRSIAVSLGYDQNDWVDIRRQMLDELETNQELYTKVYRGLYEDMRRRLAWWSGETYDSDFWLAMPTSGHLIATAFKCVVVYISKQCSNTFFPLRDPPNADDDHKFICLGLVDCHYFPIELKDGYPITPAHKDWDIYHDDLSDLWLDPYVDRMVEHEHILMVSKKVGEQGEGPQISSNKDVISLDQIIIHTKESSVTL